MLATNLSLPIDLSTDAINALCQQHHIQKLSLFGSVLREDFRADSDVDILVEFEPGCTPGFEFIDIQDQLSALVGRQVDLNTPKCLSRYFREKVIDEAQVIYANT